MGARLTVHDWKFEKGEAALHDADAIHSEKRPLLPASAKEFILRKVSEATSRRAVPRDALALLLGQEAAANGRDRGSSSPPAPPHRIAAPLLGLHLFSYCCA